MIVLAQFVSRSFRLHDVMYDRFCMSTARFGSTIVLEHRVEYGAFDLQSPPWTFCRTFLATRVLQNTVRSTLQTRMPVDPHR